MNLYTHNLANPTKSLYAESYRKFGLIEAKDDPGLLEGSPYFKGREFTADEITALNRDAQDQESFENGHHLLKGWFRPAEQKGIDPSKANLIISYTEDNSIYLAPYLEALDTYLRLDTDKVKEIKDRFNIFIAWSTSLLDALKVLKKIKTDLGDAWSKTYTLFLNDNSINTGTGPNHEGSLKTCEGEMIHSNARKLLDIPVDKSRAIIQSGIFAADRRLKTTQQTPVWAQYNEDEVLQEIENLVEDFNSRLHGFEIAKLFAANRLKIGSEEPIKKDMGCRIPIEAFVKFISQEK